MPFDLCERLGHVAGLKQLQLRDTLADQQCEPFAVEGLGFYQQQLHPREENRSE